MDQALHIANAPTRIPCVIYERSHPQYYRISNTTFNMTNTSTVLNWQEAVDEVAAPHDCVDVDANDPLYILYTSGTTGIHMLTM